MQTLKDVVKEVIQDWQTKQKKCGGDDLQVLLKKVLTKKELAHIKFSYFRKGILGLAVDSSPWLYHLNLQKERLLARLGQHLPKIKDIRFSLGEVK